MAKKNHFKSKFKGVLIILCIAIAGGSMSAFFICQNPVSAAGSSFKAGDTVSVTVQNLRVRQLPTTASKVLGSQTQKTKGTIIAGPKKADGYTWWQINYEKGADGWSAENYLAVVTPAVLGISKYFAPVSTKFKSGDRIYVSGSYASVGAQPTIRSAKKASQPKNAKGTVTSGYKWSDNLFWWQVNYDTGTDGWSPEKYLSRYVAPATSTSASNTTGTTGGANSVSTPGTTSGSNSSGTTSGTTGGSSSGSVTSGGSTSGTTGVSGSTSSGSTSGTTSGSASGTGMSGPASSGSPTTSYPIHTNITAAVFWVGEPEGNGSSEDNALSAWDDAWQAHYGGYDDPQNRNGYYPAGFTPKQNPFYLDLPYNDFNDNGNRKTNAAQVVPWASEKTWSSSESMMKNRWVKLTRNGVTCYGQIEDAGPYEYDDHAYVFGTSLPMSKEANNAGMDVSPALRDCLKFNGWNNVDNKVDWQFVNAADVPAGPWKEIVTTSQIYWP